ncbi:MAG: hypothetical protein K6348_08185, partial [Deferribacterales bacterium]
MNKFLFFLLLLLPLYLNAIEKRGSDDNDLLYLKKELDKEREELKKIEMSAGSLKQKIDLISRTISSTEAIITKVDAEYKKLNEHKKVIQNSIDLLNHDINILLKEVKKGNIYFVDNKGVINLKLLIFSNSYHEMVRNLEILEKVNFKIHEKIMLIKSKRDQIAKLEVDLANKMKEIDNIKKIKGELLRELNNDREVYRQTFVMLKQDKRNKESYLKIITSRYEDLNKRFQDVLKEGKGEQNIKSDVSGFASIKGNMDWPVRGKIIEGYGIKYIDEIKTEVFNKGVKIEVLGDGFVRVVYDGVVKYIDYIKGYG